MTASLIAAMVTALWRTAWREAIRRVGDGQSLRTVRAHQTRLLTRGFDGISQGFGGAAAP